MSRRRSSRPLAHCLGRPSAKLSRLLRRAAEHERISAQFQACLPTDLRGHCRLATQRDGTLLLHADSAAWATRLRYLLPDLKRCFPALQSADSVRVKVRQLHRRPPPLSRPAARMSKESAHLLLTCSEHVADAGLSQALRRLAQRGNKPA